MKRRGLLQSRAYKAFKNFLMRLYTNRQRQYAKLFAAEEIEREDYFQIFSSKKKNQTLPKISIDSKQIEPKTQVKKSEIPVCRQPLQAFSCPVPQYRVALISRHFSTIGGLEKTSQRIAEGFSRRGIYVHILTTDQMKKKNLHPLIHCEMLEAKKRLSFRKLEEFDRLCQAWAKAHPTEITFGMDRVRHQTHLRAGNGVHKAYLFRMEREKKRWGFISPRFNPLHQKILEIEKIAFEDPKLRLLFTNSHMVKGEIIRYYNTPPEKIQVIHNGVEWKEMETDFSTWLEKKQIICAKLGLDPSCYHFLFVGNGYKRKGLFLLLNALAHLPFKEFHLTVVGKDKNMQEFINIAEKLGLKNQISFFGERSNIRPFYQYCDCLIIPSLYDPFANVTIEALAMGLFVVSSKSNGGYEVLTKENGAIIEDLFALDSLKETLLSAIEHPKTWIRSQNTRNSIKYLDYPHPLKTLIDATLGSTSL